MISWRFKVLSFLDLTAFSTAASMASAAPTHWHHRHRHPRAEIVVGESAVDKVRIAPGIARSMALEASGQKVNSFSACTRPRV